MWVWKGDFHSVTEGVPRTRIPIFIPVLGPGVTFMVTFTQPGTVNYFCGLLMGSAAVWWE